MERLEAILHQRNAEFQRERLVINDPQLSEKLASHLEKFGCAHVSLLGPMGEGVTEFLLKETFPAQTKDKSLAEISQYWRKNKFLDTHMWGFSCRMPYPPILECESRIEFTHPITKTIHVKNPLVAKNSICLWESLIQSYPAIKPSQWMKCERYNISEDGIKLAHKEAYKTTPLHFDGHTQYQRVQIVYSEDVGPTRLCVLPGSDSIEVQELIEEISGVSITDGFKTFPKTHPKLHELLCKYSVCCERKHLQLFKASVWHYECNPEQVKQTTVLRSYIGVVAIEPTSERIIDMIVLAYLREHNWSMDPFAKENKNNRRGGLFVNDKSNQASKVFSHYEELEPEFGELKKKSIQEMKGFLREHCSPLRLELYGLNKTDLI